MKIWGYIFRRSPQNAAKPDVGYENPETTGGNASAVGQPVETNVQTDSVVGLFHRLGYVDNAAKGPSGELVISRDNRQSIVAGCGHIARLQLSNTKQSHIRGLAGVCAYCWSENMKLAQEGEIHPAEAERLSLVCSDCGEITTSGLLSCPKHRTVVIGPDGKPVYLDPAETRQLKRQQTIGQFLGILKSIFGQDAPETVDSAKQEQQYAHRPVLLHFGNIIHHHAPTDTSDGSQTDSESDSAR